MKNKDLKKIYNGGKLKFHSGFNESLMLVEMMESWQGLDVLEIGCGEGHLASILQYAGANVHAIDYSFEQIKRARENYPKVKFNVSELVSQVDVIVMQGVLEHLDDPFERLYKLCKSANIVCMSVPNWTNTRGAIYHTLRLLFDAKMSLTDLHFFMPSDFKDFCFKHNLYCEFSTCDESWGNGQEMIDDLKTRIPAAMPGIKPSNLGRFRIWMERMVKNQYMTGYLQGANLGVKITNKEGKCLKLIPNSPTKTQVQQ